MRKFIHKLIRSFQLLNHYIKAQSWPDNSVVYYAQSDYCWSPDNLKVGIGGSEQAVMALANAWVKQGYTVTVFNNCGDKAGIYNGVEYRPYTQFNPFDRFDTLVIWRYPWRLQRYTNANRILLDLHEVLRPEQVKPQSLTAYTQVFVKSQYHRTLVPELTDTQVAIIPNGCDPHWLTSAPQARDPYKLIYTSNYIRGLERMLRYGWPIIQREIPQAHLHIYYGWQSVDTTNPKLAAWKQSMLSLLEQPNVFEHGKVGIEQLMQERKTATLHYYGCTFQEIDCMAVRESALMGCIPVTTAHAALAEKPYCMSVTGNAYDQETQEKLAYKIVELLRNPDQLESIRPKFQMLAKQENWDIIAAQWLPKAT
jgi:hypothetical protein